VKKSKFNIIIDWKNFVVKYFSATTPTPPYIHYTLGSIKKFSLKVFVVILQVDG
jgi:hypothetical protein